ncbi:MAG: hypothetical protein M3256_17350 [Actinomycetota bacterium]|nr:hypothetical protein [Actinomycetota bacterium]
MTATRSTPAIAISTNGQGPPPGRNVNIGRMALGVFLVLGLSVAFAYVYAQAGQRHSVLAVAKAVPAGKPLVAGDLMPVSVSADPGLSPIPASRQASLIGRTPAVSLVKGTLLSEDQLATGSLVPAGRDVVGLSLKASQVPLGVRVGDRVLVMRAPTNPSNGTGSATPGTDVPVVARNAEVLAVDAGSTSNGGTTVVSVVVNASDAGAVAAAAAAGEASLVVEGGH